MSPLSAHALACAFCASGEPSGFALLAALLVATPFGLTLAIYLRARSLSAGGPR